MRHVQDQKFGEEGFLRWADETDYTIKRMLQLDANGRRGGGSSASSYDQLKQVLFLTFSYASFTYCYNYG